MSTERLSISEQTQKLEDAYKTKLNREKVVASYIRDILAKCVIEPKESQGREKAENEIAINLALEYLSLFSSKLHSDEAMDEAQEKWEKEVGVYKERIPKSPSLRIIKPE